MKRFFLLSLLFLATSFYGQKTYIFDYLIEYKYTGSEGDKEKTVYLLTNSNDNSYRFVTHDYNETTFEVYLRDQKQLYSSAVINKSGFFKAEKIEMPCESVRLYKDKIDLKRYIFMNNSDTLIENQKYKKYSMQYRKTKESKKYKTGKSFYIVENGTEFHKPLLIFSTQFDVSVTSEIFPNGIAKEIYNCSEFGVKSHYKLVNYTKVNKTIVFPNCPKIKS